MSPRTFRLRTGVLAAAPPFVRFQSTRARESILNTAGPQLSSGLEYGNHVLRAKSFKQGFCGGELCRASGHLCAVMGALIIEFPKLKGCLVGSEQADVIAEVPLHLA